MTAEQMVQYAYEEGFSAAAVVDTADIVFDPSFRPYCEENLCGQYGANYSCPPDCGTPEEIAGCESSYTGQYLKKTLER